MAITDRLTVSDTNGIYQEVSRSGISVRLYATLAVGAYGRLPRRTATAERFIWSLYLVAQC